MSFWTAVVCIVLIAAIARIYRSRGSYNDRHRLDESERRSLEAERDGAKEELDQLKERVKVLERIATDPSRRTAEEIEKLRDD